MDLTSEFLKEHYLNAYFVDNERTQIAVLYRESNDSDKVVETVIEHNMEHPWCQALFASGMTDLDPRFLVLQCFDFRPHCNDLPWCGRQSDIHP
jgi:hypothetical protein